MESNQNPEPTAACTPVQPPEAELVSHTLAEWEAEIAAAEQRGYLRGRNEKIEVTTAQPSLYQMPEATGSQLLNRLRPSVWDL